MGVSNFTTMRPFVVTADDVKTRWGSCVGLFRCAICGHRFQKGDTARWFYTNTEDKHKTIRGNPFICGDCNGTDAEVTARLVAMAAKVKQIKAECWWFFRGEEK